MLYNNFLYYILFSGICTGHVVFLCSTEWCHIENHLRCIMKIGSLRHGIRVTLLWTDTLSGGGNCIKTALVSFLKRGLLSKRKEFGSKLFLFRLDTFSEGAGYVGKRMGSHKNSLPCKKRQKIYQVSLVPSLRWMDILPRESTLIWTYLPLSPRTSLKGKNLLPLVAPFKKGSIDQGSKLSSAGVVSLI